MPYRLVKYKGGWRVHSPNGPKSKHPMTLEEAKAQMRVLNMVEHGVRPKGKRKKGK